MAEMNGFVLNAYSASCTLQLNNHLCTSQPHQEWRPANPKRLCNLGFGEHMRAMGAGRADRSKLHCTGRT